MQQLTLLLVCCKSLWALGQSVTESYLLMHWQVRTKSCFLPLFVLNISGRIVQPCPCASCFCHSFDVLFLCIHRPVRSRRKTSKPTNQPEGQNKPAFKQSNKNEKASTAISKAKQRNATCNASGKMNKWQRVLAVTREAQAGA